MKSLVILTIILGLFPLLKMQKSNCLKIENIKGMNNFEMEQITDSTLSSRVWYVQKSKGSQKLPGFHEELRAATFHFRIESISQDYIVEQRQRNDKEKCLKVEGLLYYDDPITFKSNAKVVINYTSPANLLPNTNHWSVSDTYWFLGADYKNYLILYRCSATTSQEDRTCGVHNVFVMSPYKYKLTKEQEKEIDVILALNCIPLYNSLRDTDWSITECTPEKEKCDMDFLQNEVTVDFNKFKDKTWYAVRQMGFHDSILPKGSKGAVVRFEMNNGQVKLIFYGMDEKENCLEPREGTIYMRNVNNGRFEIRFGFNKFDLVILTEPTKSLSMFYFCESKLNNGSCAVEKQIFLLSSERSFYGGETFSQFLTENCLDPKGVTTNDFYKDKNCSNGASIGYYLCRWIWLQFILVILLL